MYLNVVIYILIVVVKNNDIIQMYNIKYNIFLFSQVILYLTIKMDETTKKMEIMTNIYPYEKSKNKIKIGDVTIDVMNNFLSPFHQVDLFLSNLTAYINNKNIDDKIKKNEKKDDGTNYKEEDKVKLIEPHRKKQTLIKFEADISKKKGGKSKKNQKSHKKTKSNM